MGKFKNSCIILFCILNTTFVFAKNEYPFKRGTYKSRLSIAPVKSFYKNNTFHTINTKAKAGFLISYKGEYFLGKKVNLIGGLEYYTEGFTFQGYYELPGYTYVYDETFPYTHNVSIQEINMPIGIKFAFNLEEDNYFTPYYTGGLSIRYITSSQNYIVNDSLGVTVYEDKGDVAFENNIGLLFKSKARRKLNGFLYSGFGLQYNFRGTATALYFEMNYRLGLSRFNYRGNDKSNNLNIGNSNLVFSFGVRF